MMKKRLISLILVTLLALSLVVPVSAYVDKGNVYSSIDALFTEQLEQAADHLSAQSDALNFDLHVDIVSDTEDHSVEEYAQIFYDQYEYGFGENHDGALLMIHVTDNGSSADLTEFTLVGGGSGADLTDSDDCLALKTALETVLDGTDLPYDQAGDACATAIGLYESTFTALLGGSTDTVIEATVDETDALDAVDVDETMFSQSAFILDYAGLLSDSEWKELEQKAEAIEQNYQCATYVLTVDSLDGVERRDYAKQFYTANNLGSGDWRNGILFLVAMETREYVTVTYGRNPDNLSEYGTGINAFSDYGISQLENKIVPDLSDGEYYDAFQSYLSICDDYLAKYTQTGEAFDVGDAPKSKLVPALITILVPLLIAFVVCFIFLSQMHTAKAATQADDYIPKDGFNLTHQVDQYTHTTETRRTIERDHSSGGGSSVDSGGFGGSSGGHF